MTNGIYRIKIQGLLDESRSKWFEGWEISYERDGTTVLTGRQVDQSAFHGILEKIRDLNLSIVSVNRVESEE